jgi:hypothetical protein
MALRAMPGAHKKSPASPGFLIDRPWPIDSRCLFQRQDHAVHAKLQGRALVAGLEIDDDAVLV